MQYIEDRPMDFVEGRMTVSGSLNMQNIGEPGFNTLDEPIKTTIVIILFNYAIYCIILIKNY